jgi:CRP-like cAMP-binding protein
MQDGSRIRKMYQPGQLIFTENSECDGMYIIDSGKVRVFKTVGQGEDRKVVDLCSLGPKSMFGEMAMLDEKRRSASVQAIEPTVCTVITKKVFEDQLASIPSWMVSMIKIMVSRLRETNDQLRKLVAEHTNTPVGDTGGILTFDAANAQAVMPPQTGVIQTPLPPQPGYPQPGPAAGPQQPHQPGS